MNAILEALGADDESDALRIVAEANQFIGAMQTIAGTEALATVTEKVRQAHALARDVQAATDKPANEAIGVVLAWKAASEQLPQLAADLETAKESVRKQEVDQLLAEGKRAGKLTPATADFWATRSADELRAFLAVAPRVIPAVAKVAADAQPKSAPPTATADGQKYEALKPAEKARLKKSDPELFEALRNDWEERGKPAA